MRGERFDELSRSLVGAPNRRALLAGWAAAAISPRGGTRVAKAQPCIPIGDYLTRDGGATTLVCDETPCCSGYCQSEALGICCTPYEFDTCGQDYDCCYHDPNAAPGSVIRICHEGFCRNWTVPEVAPTTSDRPDDVGLSDVVGQVSDARSIVTGLVGLIKRDFSQTTTSASAELDYLSVSSAFNGWVDAFVFGLRRSTDAGQLARDLQGRLTTAFQLAEAFETRYRPVVSPTAGGAVGGGPGGQTPVQSDPGTVTGGGFVAAIAFLARIAVPATRVALLLLDRYRAASRAERQAIETEIQGLAWPTFAAIPLG